MDPSVWGPKLWFVIHTVALNFPDNPSYEDKRHYEDFFNNLTFMIPCDKCRIHYTDRLRKNPVINHLDNSDKLFRYTIHLHNDVNKSLHKPLLTYDDVIKNYKREYGEKVEEDCTINKKLIAGILIFVVLSVLGYVLYQKYPMRIIKIK